MVDLKAPETTVYANVTAAPHTDVESMKKLLIDQITQPVRWYQSMQAIVNTGEAHFIELAPSRVLTGLLKKINRRLPIKSLVTADALGVRSVHV
jgi:[acyl-carrier-protein] S-malonyltransferase